MDTVPAPPPPGPPGPRGWCRPVLPAPGPVTHVEPERVPTAWLPGASLWGSPPHCPHGAQCAGGGPSTDTASPPRPAAGSEPPSPRLPFSVGLTSSETKAKNAEGPLGRGTAFGRAPGVTHRHAGVLAAGQAASRQLPGGRGGRKPTGRAASWEPHGSPVVSPPRARKPADPRPLCRPGGGGRGRESQKAPRTPFCKPRLAMEAESQGRHRSPHEAVAEGSLREASRPQAGRHQH